MFCESQLDWIPTLDFSFQLPMLRKSPDFSRWLESTNQIQPDATSLCLDLADQLLKMLCGQVFFLLATAYLAEFLSSDTADDVIAERSTEAKESMQGGSVETLGCMKPK